MKEFKTLPVQLSYTDKLDLTQKLLKIYSVTVNNLTKREIDIISLCILFDMNDKGFNRMIIDADMGYNNPAHIYTIIHNLKQKGLVVKDSTKNRKHLNPGLQAIKDLVNSSNEVSIQLCYTNEVR